MAIDWDNIKKKIEAQYVEARVKEAKNVKRMKEVGYQALCALPEGVEWLNETPPRTKP